jgi:predicted dehydrogenase
VSVQIRGGITRGTEFLVEVHGDRGDLTLSATTRASMQQQELTVRGAQGSPRNSPSFTYRRGVAGLRKGCPAIPATMLPSSTCDWLKPIREGKAESPSFAAAVTRHHLLDAILRASETGQKQVL